MPTMSYQHNSVDLRINAAGGLSRRQQRLLLLWLAQRILFVATPFCFLAFLSGFPAFLRVGFAVLATILMLYFLWAYLGDLLLEQPQVISGILRKEKVRRRGPAHYYLVIYDIRVRAPKHKWELLEEGSLVTLYFAARTKWLLSYVFQ
jgi:hypothetical protein